MTACHYFREAHTARLHFIVSHERIGGSKQNLNVGRAGRNSRG